MILNFFNTTANLKKIKRKGWIDKLNLNTPESVADHTFCMAMIGMVLSDSKNYDTEKILKMILLHDLAESITGDYTPEEKPQNEKRILENNAMQKILNELPLEQKENYNLLWNEYGENQTREANFVHQIDKLEMALQARIYQKEGISEDKLTPFFDSAKKGINDPNLLTLLKQLEN